MTNRLSRRLSACAAVLGVLGLALLPAEHIHARTEQGHHSELIHRHFEPHHDGGATSVVGHPDDDAERWIDSAFITAASARGVHPPGQFLSDDPWTAEAAQAACGELSSAPDSVHDPPGTTSHGLRAPPSLLV